jgi:CHAT domain-containing protein
MALRRQLWEPLLPHLRGVHTVLVSPDEGLGRLPFAALPGDKPGSYLIEEVALAVVPVPQVLPQLLVERPGGESKGASLLLVGDVDFDTKLGPVAADGTGRSAPRGGLRAFARLPGTRQEVAAIKDTFQDRFDDGKVTDLRRARATKAALRSQGPRHRWLHVATHGFFAPAELRSALAPGENEPAARARAEGLSRAEATGWHPGLLSGLALAGANRAPAADEEGGILTALEVAEMDLFGVDMVTLSACETGLGKATSGEGLLGLQRAFAVAGARTTVASLWAVDDKATRDLMVGLYEKLWDRDKPLGKLEALRQAQLTMLREGVKRGLVKAGEGKGPAKAPPYYWAAFVLAGDWR